jgi:hypothetical protein
MSQTKTLQFLAHTSKMISVNAVLLLLMLFSQSQCYKWPEKTKVLHIGGIFPINGTGMISFIFK